VESDDGCKANIIGNMENYDALWTKHFREFQTDYWVTVDADFKILKGDFVKVAFEKLEENENMIVFASNYSDTGKVYDSYSNENIVLMKRYHNGSVYIKRKLSVAKPRIFIIKISLTENDMLMILPQNFRPIYAISLGLKWARLMIDTAALLFITVLLLTMYRLTHL
jgi:hypothetical protein